MFLTILPIEEYFFDPIKVGFLLVIFTLVGYILFVKCFPLSDSSWKKTEIILLICSALGIVGLLGSNRKFFYEREQISIGYRIDTYRHHFNSALDTVLYNRSFSTALYSSEVIQEIENEYRIMYLWVLENNPKFLQHVCERKALNCHSISFPQISDNDLKRDINNWKILISEYNKLVDEYQYYLFNKDINDIEFYYNIFYPIFFVLGLSYSIVRYIGEYCNSKKIKRNKNKSSKQDK